MSEIKLRLPDGSERCVSSGTTVEEVVKSISEGLLRKAFGAVIDDEIYGLHEPILKGGDFKVVNMEDSEGKQIFWHTSAHLMAYAIQRLYPDVKFAIGPAIENGFYYDFDTEHRFTPEDLEEIENEMKRIVKENPELIRTEMKREDALKHFSKLDEVYKVDLIERIPEGEVISFYTLGDFIDLCRGPHLKDVSKIKAVKLLSIAGAYFHGDEKNKMLQRIYGITFEKKKDLDEYLEFLEEAKKRDHRKLGKELSLFSMHDEGPGFPFFLPKGMVLRNILEDYWRKEHSKAGYDEIKTPLILNEDLWHRSGHWDHYKDNMYFTVIDEEDYAIKPMNCPGSIMIYKESLYSYRDFPMRWGEMGLVHRHELSGALHGLFRVRAFTQDDAHLFVLDSQVKDELKGIIELADKMYKDFGFKYHVELSTRPEDSMGTKEQWEIATNGLIEAMKDLNMEYILNEGDGAFYGPKIDFHLEDAIGRTWQCGTIQLDFQMPERFDLTFIDHDGERRRPVMIHRTIYGSMERFMGILIENFAGRFPMWLAPVQVSILPISDRFNDYSLEIYDKLKENGIRAEKDFRAEKIGKKIREAQLQKLPYMIVIGEKEQNEGKITLRNREGEDLGMMSLEDFLAMAKEDVKLKK